MPNTKSETADRAAMTRPLPMSWPTERAWNAATNEVIEAARMVAHHQRYDGAGARLRRAVVAMEKLEQEAAKRIEIERAQQRGGAA